MRLKRVFNIDIETCKTCGGQVKIVACIEDPVVIEKILTHLDRKDTSAPKSPRALSAFEFAVVRFARHAKGRSGPRVCKKFG